MPESAKGFESPGGECTSLQRMLDASESVRNRLPHPARFVLDLIGLSLGVDIAVGGVVLTWAQVAPIFGWYVLDIPPQSGARARD